MQGHRLQTGMIEMGYGLMLERKAHPGQRENHRAATYFMFLAGGHAFQPSEALIRCASVMRL
jgi:hypothetical protein